MEEPVACAKTEFIRGKEGSVIGQLLTTVCRKESLMISIKCLSVRKRAKNGKERNKKS
jgi:hypothetical protein